VQAELQEVVVRVRAVLDRFAKQGPVPERQAGLLRRYAIDEVKYADLARQLACTPAALRVRVHKAMGALRRYIETRHPEISDLLERRGAAGSAVAPPHSYSASCARTASI
jgi:DNA-directed RNA polymerase specialized sigma24 family protein